MTDNHRIARQEIVPGDRVFLSQIQHSDLPIFAQWFADLELTAYMNALGLSFSPECQERLYNDFVQGQYDQRPDVSFAIILREEQQLIGRVQLRNFNQRHATAELSIAIGEKSCWNYGYGTETVRLITDYGLTFCGLHTIYLWHGAFNQRGHYAYLKAGFKEVGRLREAIFIDGHRYDRVLMDCTRADIGPSKLRHLIHQLPMSMPEVAM